MFGLFKKKKDSWQQIFEEQQRKFREEVLPIFQAVAARLPEKYWFLQERFNSDLLCNCGPNMIMGKFVKGSEHMWVFSIDAALSKKFETKKNNFKIDNIKLYSTISNQYERLTLHIHNNIPTSFEISTDQWQFDLLKIDTGDVKEFDYGNEGYQHLLEIIGNVPRQYLKEFDLFNSLEIELKDEKFYTIKDLGDGDYIAINENKQIFGLIHGKNLVEKLFESPSDLFTALGTKEFDFESYYRSKV